MELILYNEGDSNSPVMFITHEKPANHKKHVNMSPADILVTIAKNLLAIKALAAEKTNYYSC